MMKSKRKFGHEGTKEYCRGYVDKHGQWNNGFHCPKWGNPDDEYCCGTDTHRFCCPQVDNSDSDSHKFKDHHIGILIGILLGLVLVIFLVVVIVCYFCKCCFFSKRRKRPHGCEYIQTHNQRHYARGYPICTNHSNHSGAIPLTLRSSYPPSESPPPYPGDFEGSGEEKVPLSETQFVNSDPEDSPQRLQLSPLLSSPGDQSPTFHAVLSNCNDDHDPWSRNSSGHDHINIYANHMQLNQATVNKELSMQESPMEKISPAVSSREANGVIQRPSNLRGTNSGNFTSPRQNSATSSLPDTMVLENSGAASDRNVRQNCNNEQRQLYNMVIVGVEPDLTTGLSSQM